MAHHFAITIQHRTEKGFENSTLADYIKSEGEPSQYSKVELYLVLSAPHSYEPFLIENHYLLGAFDYGQVQDLDGQPAKTYFNNWIPSGDKYPPRQYRTKRGSVPVKTKQVSVPKPRTRLETRWTFNGWEKYTKKGWMRAY